MIIGLTGKKFSGKDTVAEYLCKEWRYKQMSFADPLKDICKIIFEFTDEQLYGDKKEDIDEFWKVTPRQVLQFVGTDLFRNNMGKLIDGIDNNIWTKVLEKKINIENNNLIVISDVRFINEAETIKKLGGILFKINRNTNNADSHISEIEMDSIKADIILENNGTKDQLYNKIDLVMYTLYDE